MAKSRTVAATPTVEEPVVDVVEDINETVEVAEEVVEVPVVEVQEEIIEPAVEVEEPAVEEVVPEVAEVETVVETPVVEEVEASTIKYYVSIGYMNESKMNIYLERLQKAGFTEIRCIKNELLVGPFNTSAECIKARKLIVSKGLKGKIVEK